MFISKFSIGFVETGLFRTSLKCSFHLSIWSSSFGKTFSLVSLIGFISVSSTQRFGDVAEFWCLLYIQLIRLLWLAHLLNPSDHFCSFAWLSLCFLDDSFFCALVFFIVYSLLCFSPFFYFLPCCLWHPVFHFFSFFCAHPHLLSEWFLCLYPFVYGTIILSMSNLFLSCSFFVSC